MINILSIETGSDICSVSLSVNGELVCLRESVEGMNHSSNLAVFVDEVLRQSFVKASELSAIAVSYGPGSYTGLRIGVSLAKGMCYANNIPLISINSLRSLVECVIVENDLDMSDRTLLVPMIDARRMEVYTQIYTQNIEILTEIEAKVVDRGSYSEYSDKDIILFGSGAKKCYDILELPSKKLVEVAPSARGMIRLAHTKFESKQFEDLAYFEPLYLKGFIGTKSQKDYFNR